MTKWPSKFPLVCVILSLAFHAPVLAGQHDVHAALAPLAERKQAPAFDLIDATGKARQISNYRGKIVLLNFWATTCGGCKLEIPWFIELQKAYSKDTFTTVGIAMDVSYEGLKNSGEAWSKVRPFLVEHGLNYPVLIGDDAVSHAYDLDALPATFLIDRSGRVAASYVGVVDKSDVESNIKKLQTERLAFQPLSTK
jgi:peroxiredoxin